MLAVQQARTFYQGRSRAAAGQVEYALQTKRPELERSVQRSERFLALLMGCAMNAFPRPSRLLRYRGAVGSASKRAITTREGEAWV